MAGVLTVVSASREYLVVVSSGLLGGFSVCLVGPAAGEALALSRGTLGALKIPTWPYPRNHSYWFFHHRI